MILLIKLDTVKAILTLPELYSNVHTELQHIWITLSAEIRGVVNIYS